MTHPQTGTTQHIALSWVYRQRRTEPQPQVTCTENFVKFGDVVFEIWELTDRHIDTLIAILRTPSGVEVKRFCDTEPPAQSTMISSGGLLGCSAGADHILLKAARCHNSPPPLFLLDIFVLKWSVRPRVRVFLVCVMTWLVLELFPRTCSWCTICCAVYYQVENRKGQPAISPLYYSTGWGETANLQL